MVASCGTATAPHTYGVLILFLPDNLLVEAVEFFVGEEVDDDPAALAAFLEADARAEDATEAVLQAIEVGRAWGGGRAAACPGGLPAPDHLLGLAHGHLVALHDRQRLDLLRVRGQAEQRASVALG